MRERSYRIANYDSAMIHNLLKLSRRLRALMQSQIGLPAHIPRIHHFPKIKKTAWRLAHSYKLVVAAIQWPSRDSVDGAGPIRTTQARNTTSPNSVKGIDLFLNRWPINANGGGMSSSVPVEWD
jgi:hypothetical protein